MFDYLNEYLKMTKNKRSNTYKQARLMKARGDAFIFNQLCQEWVSRFKWEYNPPDGEQKTIATELIERTILFSDVCAFAKYSETNGNYSEETWRNFRASGLNNLSFYGYPNSCTLSDYSGKVIKSKYIPVQPQDFSGIANCALIYDNYIGWSPINTVFYYAYRLSALNSSINGCIENILGTSIISCTRGQAEDINRQRAAAAVGVPYLIKFNDDELVTTEPKLLATPGASDALKTLFAAYDKTHADFLQTIGVRVNNEIDKKSGVTPMEIVENRQNVDLNLNDFLNARLRGIEHCERIGLVGLSVSLDNFSGKVSDFDSNGKRVETGDNNGEEEA